MGARRDRRLYWDGFRDALVTGHPDPGVPERGLPIHEEPHYRRGFKDGERAVERIVASTEGGDEDIERLVVDEQGNPDIASTEGGEE